MVEIVLNLVVEREVLGAWRKYEVQRFVVPPDVTLVVAQLRQPSQIVERARAPRDQLLELVEMAVAKVFWQELLVSMMMVQQEDPSLERVPAALEQVSKYPDS